MRPTNQREDSEWEVVQIYYLLFCVYHWSWSLPSPLENQWIPWRLKTLSSLHRNEGKFTTTSSQILFYLTNPQIWSIFRNPQIWSLGKNSHVFFRWFCQSNHEETNQARPKWLTNCPPRRPLGNSLALEMNPRSVVDMVGKYLEDPPS